MNLMFIYRMLVSFFVASYLSGCAPVQPPRQYDSDAEYAQRLVKSTVLVRVAIQFVDDKGPHRGGEYGTGVVLGHRGGHTLIMTARHVCRPQLLDPSVPATALVTYGVLDHTLASHASADIYVGTEKDDDVCILDSEGTFGTVADVASAMPPVGARVTQVGAPFQNYDKDMFFISDGRYCGMQRVGEQLEHYLATLSTASGPGASGGPLWYRGKLFSIVSMGRPGFYSVALGVPLWYVRQDIDKVMQTWHP